MTNKVANKKSAPAEPAKPAGGHQPKELVQSSDPVPPTGGSSVMAPPASAESIHKALGLTSDANGNLDIVSLGAVLVKSGFFPTIKTASQAIVKIQLGKELGFAPITSVIGIHIIEDKDQRVSVMVGAHLIAAKIRKSGIYDYKIVQHDNEGCRLEALIRRDGHWDSDGFEDFTVEDAKIAKLGGFGKDGSTKFNHWSNWAKYPKNMCFARCVSNLLKFHFADLTGMPMYGPDELGYRVTADGEPIVVNGALIRDEERADYVPPDNKPSQQQQQQPTNQAPTEKKPGRAAASKIAISKLATLAEEFKWETGQVFEMLIAEHGLTIPDDAANDLLHASKLGDLQRVIAEDSIDRCAEVLKKGPAEYFQEPQGQQESAAAPDPTLEEEISEEVYSDLWSFTCELKERQLKVKALLDQLGYPTMRKLRKKDLGAVITCAYSVEGSAD